RGARSSDRGQAVQLSAAPPRRFLRGDREAAPVVAQLRGRPVLFPRSAPGGGPAGGEARAVSTRRRLRVRMEAASGQLSSQPFRAALRSDRHHRGGRRTVPPARRSLHGEAGTLTRRMLINARRAEELRVAILDDDRLDNYQVEVSEKGLQRGNIYRG